MASAALALLDDHRAASAGSKRDSLITSHSSASAKRAEEARIVRNASNCRCRRGGPGECEAAVAEGEREVVGELAPALVARSMSFSVAQRTIASSASVPSGRSSEGGGGVSCAML